ncbi:hypothetical protein TELCIR_00529 [Teladorsagia circumcincta]|uniref:Uncharacterized protein n=1 Tax=Teladorsagia circumcincta TaxID=45464 RepID=A0A2G9V4B7_TELCI|nr:hypothetical protein TELCIR_00529 [Teladorsagia circumcincta]
MCLFDSGAPETWLYLARRQMGDLSAKINGDHRLAELSRRCKNRLRLFMAADPESRPLYFANGDFAKTVADIIASPRSTKYTACGSKDTHLAEFSDTPPLLVDSRPTAVKQTIPLLALKSPCGPPPQPPPRPQLRGHTRSASLDMMKNIQLAQTG